MAALMGFALTAGSWQIYKYYHFDQITQREEAKGEAKFNNRIEHFLLNNFKIGDPEINTNELKNLIQDSLKVAFPRARGNIFRKIISDIISNYDRKKIEELLLDNKKFIIKAIENNDENFPDSNFKSISILLSDLDVSTIQVFLPYFEKNIDSVWPETHREKITAFYELLQKTDPDTIKLYLPIFEKKISDPHWLTRAVSLELLATLLLHLNDQEEIEYYLPLIAKNLTHKDCDVRMSVLETLNKLLLKINPKNIQPHLLAISNTLNDKDIYIRIKALDILKTLLPLTNARTIQLYLHWIVLGLDSTHKEVRIKTIDTLTILLPLTDDECKKHYAKILKLRLESERLIQQEIGSMKEDWISQEYIMHALDSIYDTLSK